MFRPDVWSGFATVAHLAGASAAATVAVTIARRRRRFVPPVPVAVAALAATAAWNLAVAVSGNAGMAGQLALGLRNLAYLGMLFTLFAGDGRDASVRPVRPVLFVLAVVAVLQPLAAGIEAGMQAHAGPGFHAALFFHFNTMLALLDVVGALVLVHNLYVGADAAARHVLRWPAAALAVVWCFELNLYTIAWVGSGWPVPLAALHGFADVGFALALLIAASQSGETLRLRPSRAVTFHSASLLLIGAYVLAMVAVAQWLADAGGGYGRWFQFGFLIAAISVAALALPSRRVRTWLRVVLTKHFFQHRYDYRAEWLRFTRTMGRAGADAAPLNERAIRALADITDSPGGLLLVPDDDGDLVLAARWQWPEAEVPAKAFAATGVRFLEAHDFIIDLHHTGTAARPGGRGGGPELPDWLCAEPRAWAMVPLLHYERMIGAVVLARPPQVRRLDWEDFDLLRVAGQQLASYLAEHASAQALAEAGRFDDFHRRIAFVMHDIKNLASQFTLLARNAERHAENPEFRADMLVTLRNSAEKLGTLVARLSRYGGGVERIEPVALGGLAQSVVAGFAERHPVQLIEQAACVVAGNRHSLEHVLTHLVQNAVDASAPGSPVHLAISAASDGCRIEIVDSGHGMSPDFVRNRLFRPFDSSKPGGFGIGAYEARALIRAMNGRLDVESREGVGTRFVIHLPLSEQGGAASASADRPGTPDPAAEAA